ncbi:MAG TPA: 16S rRNA (adenine(1518)-N(6)/adenine(1519)-N(6))-dimethyltransferase RsmA [bacterium]|nr:16S rRNA (adenine(1518)-N(6)/adenine(1519)-N(6))-dimethyltransferase RsmA [bacterium]
MDLLEQTVNLCKLYNIVPNKVLGQNFLIDENVLNNIVYEAYKLKSKNILEIGGGFGFLTNKLLDVAERVVVIEKDEKLFNGLQKIEKISNNKLKVILGDVLNLFNRNFDMYSSLKSFFNSKEYSVVANIPYNITSILLRRLLEEKEYYPKNLILMVQEEVGNRICEVNNNRSILSVMANFYCKSNILFYVKRQSFYPVPDVDSVVIKLERIDDNLNRVGINNLESFFKFVKAGFSNRRKMLYHNISSVYRLDIDYVKGILEKNNLNIKIRAQDLTVNDWILLWYNINYEK